MGHENLCAFSEISSASVCAIFNERSLMDRYPKGVPTAKKLVWNKSPPYSRKKLKNLLGEHPRVLLEPRSGEKNFLGLLGGPGHALRKILK